MPPISANIPPPIPVPCRPACCKSPSPVHVIASSNGQVNPSEIFVQFSNEVEGLNSSTFVVKRTSGAPPLNTPIPGGVGFEPGPRIALFLPSAPLASGVYEVTLSGLTDARGCKLAPFSFSFTVCADPTTLVSESPANGANTNTSIAQNTAVITFSSVRKLVSFTLVGNIIGPIAGTVAPAVGSDSTSFTFTPSGVTFPPVHVTATVVVDDPDGACQQTFTWAWTAHAL